MDIIEGLDRFYFDDDQIINQQIQAITTIELYTLVNQGERYLSGNLSASFI